MVGVWKSLRVETGMKRATSARAWSAIPDFIKNASQELEGKRVIVLDPRGAGGNLASKASGVRDLWGSVQAVPDEWALVGAVASAMVGRAIVLLPPHTNQSTVDRLLLLENVKKGLPIYIAGWSNQLKGATVLSEQDNLITSIVAKVRKLVK